jgi:hypothetical protein
MRKLLGEVCGIPVIADDAIPTGTVYCMPRGTIHKWDHESLGDAIDRYVRENSPKFGVITNIGKE